MTFSVLGTDGTAVGIAISSSSPAVAARCVHLRPGVGGAASQNVTDPRLGTALLDALERGLPPDKALAEVVAATPEAEYRQLTVLNLAGESAVFSGARALGVVAERRGRSVVSAGNLLATPDVIDAAARGFESAEGELELRLLAALEAGLAAGGEAGPLHSAGLSVVRATPWRETDLRVDWRDEPIAELRRLAELWLPQRDDYVARALRPGEAPSYGVPGDE
ncbi:DUF1028 domain-containing protein [Nonomuraea rubra]|uniref:Putative Ntn-hydrolase superfamily protein n=1 Tax=Nonomuraea rubra TaxID=46180 RepID=A0A7X0NVJ8_9ACTN|nr:DUF1028 domain-containing protein [Nonomuraea rubra]MBB6550370.1 putative Ntn-hydrolase superfamily protein [Nonomuraea rubra]